MLQCIVKDCVLCICQMAKFTSVVLSSRGLFPLSISFTSTTLSLSFEIDRLASQQSCTYTNCHAHSQDISRRFQKFPESFHIKHSHTKKCEKRALGKVNATSVKLLVTGEIGIFKRKGTNTGTGTNIATFALGRKRSLH